MGAVHEDLPDHEGYAVEHGRAHIGACSCGWRDEVHAADFDAAVDRWDQHHAAPLLEYAVPTEVADLVDDARRAVAHLARTRPKAATVVLDRLERSVDQLRALAHDFDRSPPTIAERLGAVTDRRNARGLGR